jgi:hypothetical protein
MSPALEGAAALREDFGLEEKVLSRNILGMVRQNLGSGSLG